MFLKNKPALSLRGSVTTAAITCLLLLIACGDDTTEVISGQNYIEIVAEESDLPECSEDNEGEQVLVKGENIARTCVDGEWTAAFTPGRDTVYLKNKDISCYTKELADKQGVKIICDGDSVGVLLNGSAGDKGADGAGCSLKQLDSVTARQVCGSDTMTVYLGLPADTAKTVPTTDIDSEKIPVSLDSLVGNVYFGTDHSIENVRLYGLGDGRTLKRSGGFYTSEAGSKSQYYKFRGFELPSQYATLEVGGVYYNAFYGRGNDIPMRLRAITNLAENNSVNVNVLTHLEFDRVNYLVTHEGMTVKQAKKQAQSEVFDFFYIDAKDFDVSERLDYYGESDTAAALFAVSVLVMLAEQVAGSFMQDFVTAIETTGKWSGDDADSRKTSIADRMMVLELPYIRYLFEIWASKGEIIGDFEKYIENFIEKVYAMEPCGEGSVSEQRVVNNEKSRFHGKVFQCHGGLIAQEYKNTFTNPDINYGWMVDMRDRHAYRTVTIGEQTWMAENLNYTYRGPLRMNPYDSSSFCYNGASEYCDKYGMLYSWGAAMDSVTYGSGGYHCGYGVKCSAKGTVRGICPVGWHLPSKAEWDTLIETLGAGSLSGKYLKSMTGWPDGGAGSDNYGFSALPAGESLPDAHISSANQYSLIEENAQIWSSTESSATSAYYLALYYDDDVAHVKDDGAKNLAFSVRCIKD